MIIDAEDDSAAVDVKGQLFIMLTIHGGIGKSLVGLLVLSRTFTFN